MKALAILAVLFAALLPIHGQEKASHTQTNQKRSPDPHKPESPPSTTVWNVINQETTKGKSDNSTERPKGYLARLFSAENLPNIGLFAVGVAGVFTALCTLRKIERQVFEMRLQSRAAMKQAIMAQKTLVATFRPKLIIRATKLDMSNALSRVDDHGIFRLVLANVGGTTAHIPETVLSIDCLIKDVKDEVYPIGTETVDKFDLRAGEIKIISSKITQIRPQAQIAEMQTESDLGQWLWIRCSGVFRFTDDNGIERRIGFRRRYDAKTAALLPDADPEYEFGDEA
jgi:hypothetical protein